jgi:hypothetical protein
MMNKSGGDIGMGEIQRLSACRNPTIITLSMLSLVEENEIVSTYQRRGVISRKSPASGYERGTSFILLEHLSTRD